MKLYVNGALEDSLWHPGPLYTAGGPVLIGTLTGLPSNTFNGLIDEVGIYRGAMDADTIRDTFLADIGEGYTPSGDDVVVKPVDPVTETQPVTVTFDEVIGEGMTSVTTTATGPTPPTGFYLAGVHYDLTTTASFSEWVTVCIEYNDSGMSEAEEEALKLYHFENNKWVDVTVPPVDTVNNIICGRVSSFSIFAVLLPEDTTSPTISDVTANPDVLWPANHKMVEVTVAVEATDNSSQSLICLVVDVTCNETINDPEDSGTEPDWNFIEDNPLAVLLRAERTGGGDGRVYTIHVGCMDASGNTTTATVDVTVPHDQSKGKKK